jgi:FtsP/CotA-like multicopper oxidase with cupredoxin domain
MEERPGARLRLRLANLSANRIMILTFVGVQPFVIAIDGQPCEAFEPVRRSIPVAPGARFELMFDMPKTEGAKARLYLRGAEGADSDLLVATAKGSMAEGRGLIYSLPSNPALPAEIKLGNARKIDLVIEPPHPPKGVSWTINGTTGGYDGKPLFQVKKNSAVTLGFVNHADKPIAMRVHGHAVRLLHDLDDGWEPYWRNAVIVPAGKTKHVAFIADAPGRWAIHDDILEHEAAGNATYFAVD